MSDQIFVVRDRSKRLHTIFSIVGFACALFFVITGNPLTLVVALVSSYSTVRLFSSALTPTPFIASTKNGDLESRINNIAKLISLAQKEVFIFCGNLNPDVYESDLVRTEVLEAIGRGVNFKIYLETVTENELSNLARLIVNSGGSVKTIPTEKEHNHLIAIDGRHARIEFGHTSNKKRRARILYNDVGFTGQARGIVDEYIEKKVA